jgi:hypothetical protein
MKMLGKLILGALVIGGAVALTAGAENVVSEGEYKHSETGEIARWKVVKEKEGKFTGHIKFPGQSWVEIAERDSENALGGLINERMTENGYVVVVSPGMASKMAGAMFGD